LNAQKPTQIEFKTQ